MLRRWMYGFGVAHTVLWFDEVEECGGAKSMKTLSFGMCVWAVRCEILGVADLCTNLGRVGALVYQLVGMPWSRLGGCYYYGVYQVCYLFYLCMLVDFVRGVMNSLFYVPVVMNVVVPACKEVISEREKKRGE